MRRPKFAILALALVIAAVIIFWPGRSPMLDTTETAPKVQAAPKSALNDLGKPASLFHGSLPSSLPQVDPANQQVADRLNSPETEVMEDLQIVAEFIDIYRRATGGQPIGDNADITAALTGTQYPGQKGQIFPRQHNAIRGGQLVDRWGSPFWFHPNSGHQLEIRSAGPDRQLFTADDIVQNPSPAGLGVTPQGPTSP